MKNILEWDVELPPWLRNDAHDYAPHNATSFCVATLSVNPSTEIFIPSFVSFHCNIVSVYWNYILSFNIVSKIA